MAMHIYDLTQNASSAPASPPTPASFPEGAVIAIGNFDGVHRGHEILINAAKKLAGGLGRKTAVMTFEPHPQLLFRPDDPPFRLTPWPVKEARLRALSVDAALCLDFTWDFASQSAQDFIDRVLRPLAPSHIVVGYDFHFGQLRRGTPQTLVDAGFKVTIVDQVSDEGNHALSSSRIREALREGRIEEANSLLGWDWFIEGEIVKGNQRGRELGYPTANVALCDTIHPAYGIYASLARLPGDGKDAPWMPSATNIGIRPMFELKTGQVETFIFDFDRDIYGQTLQVRPVRRLRGEAKFASLEALVAQMEDDCRQAKALLA